MARGDLCCYRGADPLARLVEWREGTQGEPADLLFSHVGVQVSEGEATDDRLLVVEAVPPKVHLAPHGLGVGERRFAMAARYRPEDREAALAWLIAQVGRGYGVGDIIANACEALRLPLDAFDPNTWDCSHLAFVYLSLAGERWLASGFRPATAWVATPALVTPASLAHYCAFVLKEK